MATTRKGEKQASQRGLWGEQRKAKSKLLTEAYGGEIQLGTCEVCMWVQGLVMCQCMSSNLLLGGKIQLLSQKEKRKKTQLINTQKPKGKTQLVFQIWSNDGESNSNLSAKPSKRGKDIVPNTQINSSSYRKRKGLN